MAIAKTFTASNFGMSSRGTRNAEFTASVNGVSMAVRKIEMFVVAPEFAPLSDIVAVSSDIVPCYAFAAKTGDTAVLNIDKDDTPQNSAAAALIKTANANRDKVTAAAAEYKTRRDAKQAAAIMTNPEALEMVKEMLKQQEAAAKKEAAAAKRAAKKATATK